MAFFLVEDTGVCWRVLLLFSLNESAVIFFFLLPFFFHDDFFFPPTNFHLERLSWTAGSVRSHHPFITSGQIWQVNFVKDDTEQLQQVHQIFLPVTGEAQKKSLKSTSRPLSVRKCC